MTDATKQNSMNPSENEPEPTEETGPSFADLGLPEEVLQALKKALPQITNPTPIQSKAIPLAMSGKDIIGSARTGTGKTFAFSLPTLATLLDDDNRETVAVILTPTRELAAQIEAVLQPLLRTLKMPRPCLLIGGVSFGPQMAALRARPRVIVATPGRLLDHMESGRVNTDLVKVLVLDEADRMLDMGFLPQVRAVCKDLTRDRQTFLFTATLPKEIRALAKEFMNEPESIFVDPPTTASQQVTQQKVSVGDDKKGALLDAVNGHEGSILVFARTRRRTDHVASYLEEYGVKVESIHGDRSQHQRLRAIESFRTGRARVLVATDIAARGLDIPQVGLVINFDLPETKEDYVHRIGRTGRAGATGVAVSFVASNEERHWRYMTGEGKESDRQPSQHGRGRGASGSSKFQGGKRFGGKPAKFRRERDFDAPKASQDRPREEKRTFGEKREFGEKRGFGEKRTFGEKREFGEKRGFGEKRSFGEKREFGEKRGFGEKRTFGEKREFGEKRGFGEKRTFGEKRSFGRDRFQDRSFQEESKDRPRTNWRENFEKPNRERSPHPFDEGKQASEPKRSFDGERRPFERKPFKKKPFGASRSEGGFRRRPGGFSKSHHQD